MKIWQVASPSCLCFEAVKLRCCAGSMIPVCSVLCYCINFAPALYVDHVSLKCLSLDGTTECASA